MGTSTRNCTVSGTETVIFSDVDNSNTPTDGDTVTVRYQDCRDDANLALKGQYTLSLNSPPAGAEGVGSFGGVVQFAQFNAMVTGSSTSGTQIDGTQSSASPASLQLDGNVTFSSVVSETVEQLQAKTDDKGLKMQSLDVTNPYSETLILNNAQKNLDRVSATYQVILDTVLQSQRLSGQIEVSTPDTVTGSLNAFPTSEFFRVKGAVAIVDVYGTPLSTSKVDMRYSDSNNANVSLGSPD